MQRWLFIILLAVWSPPVLGADVTPPSPSPPPSLPKDQSAEKSIPDSPSTRDPGMVKQPETVPHPDSVVTPPVIDHKMAVDPEANTKEERHPALPPDKKSTEKNPSMKK